MSAITLTNKQHMKKKKKIHVFLTSLSKRPKLMRPGLERSPVLL